MKALKMFSIPVKGLGIGTHHFEFSFEDEFFENFEKSDIKSGSYRVEVTLNKQIRMMEFHFDIQGSFKAACDRCLEQISVPSSSYDRLLVKIGDPQEENENEEVIYIDENENNIDLAHVIHEFIHLSKPIQNVIDCEENDFEFCDLSVLDKMNGAAEDQEIKEKQDPTWDQLKNIELG